MKSRRGVTIFAGARIPENPALLARSYELGCLLGLNDYDVYYGAGGEGLMGAVARGAIEMGARVYGITCPEVARERTAPERVVVAAAADLRDRQRTLLAMGDAYIVLPGGHGTMYELFEVLTNHSLGIGKFRPPRRVHIMNFHGFYDELIAHLVKVYRENLSDFTDILRNHDINGRLTECPEF